MFVTEILRQEYVDYKPTHQSGEFDTKIHASAHFLKVLEYWCLNNAWMEWINADVSIFQPSV